VEHKAQNHERTFFLSVAPRSFREHGGDSSGIGTVIEEGRPDERGLFYRHVKSKADLSVEAVATRHRREGKSMLEIARSGTRRSGSASHHGTRLSPAPRELARMGCVVSGPRAQSRATKALVRAKDD